MTETDTMNVSPSSEKDHITGDEQVLDHSDISHIIHLVIQCLLFMIGFFLHFKIIHVCKAEKNKTWLVQISHAVVTTVHFGVRIPFQAVTHFIPNLSSYIGSWMCYIGAFNGFFGYQEISSHSLWVSIEKYILIVHTLKARSFGDDKIEKIFCWIHVVYPFLGSAIGMLTTNYATRADVKSCFGILDEDLQIGNSTAGGRGNFLYCDVSQYAETSLILSHIIQFFCVSRNSTNFIIISNIPEALLYYKIFATMKRQVTPMEDNPAANSLAKEIQIRNVRKVAVNARIAAVLCSLEFVANLAIAFVWIVVVGSSSAGGLTNAMVWYYVILPFTHLMNTSYNKDRVVDDGWKSVILNAVKSICRSFSKSRTSDEAPKGSKDSELEDKMIPRHAKKQRRSNLPEPDVSIISLEHETHETTQRASTSNGLPSAHDENINRSKICNQPSTDSESDNYKATPAKSHRLKKGEILLTGMWHNLSNEDVYAHYFKLLLELEYPSNKATVEHYKNFVVVPYKQSSHNAKMLKPKSSRNHRKNERSASSFNKTLKSNLCDETLLNVQFVINLEERMKQRENKLEGFLIHCDDENAYENFIKRLISFEEELIQN